LFRSSLGSRVGARITAKRGAPWLASFNLNSNLNPNGLATARRERDDRNIPGPLAAVVTSR
jgi:hypothetical protein